jgi:hypothetical protein
VRDPHYWELRAKKAEEELQREKELTAAFSMALRSARARAAKAENQLARVVGTVRGLGYHAPGECRHGMANWCGDHCIYDMPALTAAEEP